MEPGHVTNKTAGLAGNDPRTSPETIEDTLYRCRRLHDEAVLYWLGRVLSGRHRKEKWSRADAVHPI